MVVDTSRFLARWGMPDPQPNQVKAAIATPPTSTPLPRRMRLSRKSTHKGASGPSLLQVRSVSLRVTTSILLTKF